jgi:hypothetical protein
MMEHFSCGERPSTFPGLKGLHSGIIQRGKSIELCMAMCKPPKIEFKFAIENAF